MPHRFSLPDLRIARLTIAAPLLLACVTGWAGPRAYGDDPTTIPLVIVPGDDAQPDGPVHTFRVGVYEITNAEYATFLNCALLAPHDGRGQYMYHDIDSGDVYLNTNGIEGETGTDGAGTYLFDASVGHAITFTDGVYTVTPEFESHPVVGVSWYGAAKFCNWLTLEQGGDPQQRAYIESTDPGHWRPAVIDELEWQSRDLTDAERADLVATVSGYRLPMDDFATGATRYNEWYKAAAWNGVEDTWFGFGRDVLTGRDANYQSSGDPYDDGTTPVGYFDGSTHATFATTDTDNRYGLYDACGNVAEWMQDQGDDPATRTVRGGHWSVVSEQYLQTRFIRQDAPAATRAWIGFRIAQAGTLTPMTVIHEPCPDGTDCPCTVSGPAGGPYTSTPCTLTLRNDSLAPIEWTASAGQSWITIDGETERSGVLPYAGSQEITVELAADADSLLPPAVPAVPMEVVPGTQWQPFGPLHSFRMGVFEVSNDMYLAFLNNALALLDDPRGAYLYHDTDSSRIYIHPASEIGEVGTRGSGTLLFDGRVGNAIRYDDEQRRYVLTEAGESLADHPVVGVSWFGAVKYCNWLTLHDGLDPAHRAYSEGTRPQDWHPVVISGQAWLSRGLTDAERSALVNNYAGYRLPMDHNASAAARYNEWYKAAAWDAGLVRNRDYGFGRDALTPADANYANSGDPYESTAGTTPMGYYDGSDHGGVFPTRFSSNGFTDLCGNVREWMQDRGDNIAMRAVRGGSWSDDAAAAELLANSRQVLPADTVDAVTGFRVVQARIDHFASVAVHDVTVAKTVYQELRLNVREPMTFFPDTDFVAAGMYGGPFPQTVPYVINSESASTMGWEVSTDQPWVAVDGVPSASGELAPPLGVVVEIGFTDSANELAPGEYEAIVQLANTTTGYTETRSVSLAVEDPLDVSPAGDDADYEVTTLYQTPAAADPRDYLLVNRLDTAIEYEVTADRTWIRLNGEESIPGTTLEPGETAGQTVSLSVNEDSAALGVGTHVGTVTFANTTVGSEVTRAVILTVEDPLRLTPEEAFIADGEYGGPFDPTPAKDYTVTNRFPYPIEWSASVDTTWLRVNGESSATGTLDPEASETLTVSIEPTAAATLTEGTHEGTVSLVDHDTGYVHTRDAALTIGPHLTVDPPEGIQAHRAADGTLVPFEQTYTVTNHDIANNTFRVRVEDGCDWVWINCGLGATETLGPYDSARVRVTIDPEAAAAFESDQSCGVTFENVTTGQEATTLSMAVILSDTVPQLAPPAMAAVPGSDPQPNGPTYDFLIGTLETTNDQFVVFLNDALAHPDDERGEYLYINADTGSVFIHTERIGTVGPDIGDTLVFDAEVNGHITFDGAAYGLDDPAYGAHPAVGVTWYGAVKFCNWLTVDQGLGPNERCYGEGTADALGSWRPVTVSEADWLAGRMPTADRHALITLHRGYRLPMDGETLAADPYNEWYKAAAWRSDLNRNMIYGYGRDTYSGSDANCNASGDPFEGLDPGTTPAGYYEGEVHDGFATHVNSNGYGAYDMTGNAFEWMTDLYGGYTKRAIRGGSWAFGDAASPGIDNAGRLFVFPDRAYSQLGFRVARVATPAPPPGDFDRDGDLDNDDYTEFEVCLAGPAAEVMSGATLDLDADLHIDLADFAIWQRLIADGP